MWLWGALAHQWPVVVAMAAYILNDLVEKSDLERVTGSPREQKLSQVQRWESTSVRPRGDAYFGLLRSPAP